MAPKYGQLDIHVQHYPISPQINVARNSAIDVRVEEWAEIKGSKLATKNFEVVYW
jgi:hypothetical protein